MTIEPITQVLNAILPENLRKPTVHGLQFVISETPNASAGKYHAQVRLLNEKREGGLAKVGNYFATLESAADFLNKTMASCQSGCDFQIVG